LPKTSPTPTELSDSRLELAQLRRLRGVTQVQLAERLGTSQGNVSELEHRAELYVATLRAFVEGLGGRLEVAAVFPDEPHSLPLSVGVRVHRVIEERS
jgi:transcriptional regulator with XRE-family HTH domain